MPVNVVCPACAATLPGVPDELLGKSIKCTSCREPVKVVAATGGSLPKAAALPALAPPPPTPARVARAMPMSVSPPPTAADDDLMEAEVIADEDTPADGIDVEVLDDEPAPAKRSAAVAVARKPRVEEADDEEADTIPRAKKPAAEEKSRPTVKVARREDDAPRKSRRDADAKDDPPKKKKSALPLILGLIVGLVVLGGAGAAVAVIVSNNATVRATELIPVRPTAPDTTPPTETSPTEKPATPTTRAKPVTPATKPTPPVDPGENPFNPRPRPNPSDPPVKPVDPPVTPVAKKDRIAPDTLEKLKRSTVYIEVDDGVGGGGTGSGWFGGEPGLVVTNAHVLGMKYPGARPPANVTVYTDSGVKGTQKQFDGQKVKILAVDRDMDLAVLQIVNEPDLPPPLSIRPAAQTQELDKLVCLGFPGGRRLADRNRSTDPPAVTVTESAVSAFRKDDGDNLFSVQLQGGVVHGNSGGPVCDLDGNVIGVAVRVDIDHRGQMTNIAYAVPAEYVDGLLAGRAAETTFGQGYVKGDRVAFPISVRCADALNRLKSVGVGVWIGEKGRSRPAGDAHAEQKGDVGYREVPLVYDKAKKVATGEIDFPKDADGRVYWVQVYYSNARVAKRYLAGTSLPPGEIPVERSAVDLSARYPVGSEFKLTVAHELTVRERIEKDGVETFDQRTVAQELKLKELVEKAKAATAHAQLDQVMTGSDARIEVLLPGEKPGLSKELLDAKDALTKWDGLVAVARDGKAAGVTVTAVGLSPTVDAARKDLANRLARQWADTVAESVVKLPGKSVNAGDTWTDSQNHRFKLRQELLLGEPKGSAGFGTVKEEVTYTYLGRRDRAGRGEAVVKVDGVLRPVGEDGTCGSVEGRVILDEKTGVVLSATLKREFDLDLKGKEGTRRASGTEVVKITRER
jgi:S1-C subfamily serine protease